MEIEGEDGTKISIQSGSKREFGRGKSYPSDDHTVSRRHILFHLLSSTDKDKNSQNPKNQDEVHFEALGKNPVWVLDSESGEIRVFRKSDKGMMRVGDCFCVSVKQPILFSVKRSGDDGKEEGLSELEQVVDEEMAISDDLGFESGDVSDIDPVKEFGFLVIGHEFDDYPKTIIRDIKDWEWFLEEPRKDSETDDDTERSSSKGKKGVRRKKKHEDNDVDDWTGESEDEKVVISKLRRGKRPRYNTTRSKDYNKSPQQTGSSTKLDQKKTVRVVKNDEEEEDNEEDEETLEDFIVTDEETEEDEEEELEDDDQFVDEDDTED